MPYKAVVFDLYGTLVDNFSSQAYDQVQEQMAKTLNIPYPKFRQVMLETINDKSANHFLFFDRRSESWLTFFLKQAGLSANTCFYRT